MTVYDRIRMLREFNGISQQKLAELTGYKDRSSIAQIERGHFDISIEKLSLFAEALHTTPMYLMGWDENEEVMDNAIQSLYNSLSPEHQEQALAFLNFLKSTDKK